MMLCRPLTECCFIARRPILILKPLQKYFSLFWSSQLETGRHFCKRTNLTISNMSENETKLFLVTTDRILFILANLISNKLTDRIHFIFANLIWTFIYGDGMPVADSLLSTNDYMRFYFNTISDLAYIDNGYGISLTDYANHLIMVFDLTSAQKVSHDFVNPELNNCSIPVKLKFLAALLNNTEIFIIAEKASTIFVIFARRVSKNHFKESMDEDDINVIIR